MKAFVRDASIALAAFAGQLGLLAHGGLDSHHYHNLDARGVALAALTSLPLAVWRRNPLGVFVATTLGSATLNLLDYPSGPPLGPTVALFLFAATSSGLTRATVAIVGGLLLAHIASVGIGQHTFPTAPVVFGVLVWTVTVFAGDRVRLHRERLERGRRLAAAEERTRIARDLHDSVGHAINVILVQAGAARLLRERDPAGSEEALETIEAVARQTVGEIDALVHSLREGNGDGRVEAQPGLAALDTLVAQHRLAGLDVEVSREGERRPLPATTDQASYRILQEALTNAARHGLGDAAVAVRYGERELELTVRNRVAPGSARQANGGHGLTGMRERAALLGGTLAAVAGDGDFTVHAVLPLERAQ